MVHGKATAAHQRALRLAGGGRVCRRWCMGDVPLRCDVALRLAARTKKGLFRNERPCNAVHSPCVGVVGGVFCLACKAHPGLLGFIEAVAVSDQAAGAALIFQAAPQTPSLLT